LLFATPLLQFNLYQSHDSEGHVARFAAYFQSFRDGQFPPRWAGNLNYHYGTPVFIFYYPLPGYLASGLHGVGISYEHAYILLMIAGFIFAPLFFYFWIKEYIDQDIAFIGAIFYALTPYHFLNVYVRGDIAETIAYAFVPLVFYFIEKYIKSNTPKYLILGGISYALLILSHNGVSLMFSGILFLYALLRCKNRKTFFYILSIFMIGLFLSAFFWLPALYESKYVNAQLFIGHMYQRNFPSLLQLIYSEWAYGTQVQLKYGLSPQIGILFLILTVSSLFIIYKSKYKKQIIFWLAVFIAALFITLPQSSFLWERIPTLRLYQFPWRFTGLSSFAAIVISCFVLNHIKSRKLSIACVILLMIISVPFMSVIKYYSNPDKYYDSFRTTTDFGATISIWTQGDPGKFASSQIEIIGGRAKIENITRNSHIHTFDIISNGDSQILDNTTYFPGWTVTMDGKKIPVEFQDMNHRGLITFYVPKGKHSIIIQFNRSPDRLIGEVLTLVSVAAVLLWSIILLSQKAPAKKKNKKKENKQ